MDDKSTRDVLLDLKREIHNNAVYPHGYEVAPYITVKVFDAVLNNFIKKYEGGD